VVTYRRSKTKQNFTILPLKVVTVAYERWLLARGSKYMENSSKYLENTLLRRDGCLWEMVSIGGSIE